MFPSNIFTYNPVTASTPASDPVSLHAGDAVKCYLNMDAEYSEASSLKRAVQIMDAFYKPLYSNQNLVNKVKLFFLKHLPFLRPREVRIAEIEVLRIKGDATDRLVEKMDYTTDINTALENKENGQIIIAIQKLQLAIIKAVKYTAYFSMIENPEYNLFKFGIDVAIESNVDSSTDKDAKKDSSQSESTVNVGRSWIRKVMKECDSFGCDLEQKAAIGRSFNDLASLIDTGMDERTRSLITTHSRR